MGITDLVRWFAGGSHGYMSLIDCMNRDIFWIAVTLVFAMAVALGFVSFAVVWRRNAQPLNAGPVTATLHRLRTVVLLCGLCGFLMVPVALVWPAWRLYDGFLVVLAIMTWRCALKSRDLALVG